VQNIKRMVGLDSKKLDYREMTDVELQKNQSMNYSFKFMETAADKEMARKRMNSKQANAIAKLSSIRKLKAAVKVMHTSLGLVRSGTNHSGQKSVVIRNQLQTPQGPQHISAHDSIIYSEPEDCNS